MNTISITDLRQNATKILDRVESSSEPTYVLQNSRVKAVILDAKSYEMLEDYMDGLEAQEALKEPGGIPIEEYVRKRWGKKYVGNRKTIRRKAA